MASTVGTRIANNMGIEAARVWLGHTDIQTTLRYVYSTETNCRVDEKIR